MATYEAILFDLDGTVCQQTGDMTGAYRKAFAEIGVEPFASPADLWKQLEGPPDPDDDVGYIATAFARLAAVHDRHVDPVRLSDAFLGEIDRRAVTFVPGAERALTLSSEVAATGLITNGPRDRQEPKVDELNLEQRFDTIVYAGDLKRRKPLVDPFESALEVLDVTPEEAVYVGDSLAYDIAGAHTAGLDSVWLRPQPEADLNGYSPDWTVDSLEEFETVLADSPEGADTSV